MSPPRVLRNRLISRSRRPNRLRPSVDACTVAGPCAPLSLAALALAALAALAPASAAAAPTLTACRGQDEFGCATLDVPLDRTGATPGTVALHYAVQRDGPRKLLIALSGGPGQSAVSSASSFAISLDPALRRYRLAVLDQRGTGKSGVLELPQPAAAALAGPVHAPGGRQLREPHRAAARLLHDGRHGARHRRAAPGARRGQDRAHGDLVRHPRRAAVRARLPRARRPADPRLDRRPRRPRRLPARHLPQPAARARRAVRARRVPQRDQGPGGRRGRARAAHQRERPAARRLLRRAAASARATQYATPDELSFLLIAGDLNPFLQAALPAAISAARRGDTAPLMRLRRIGQGGPTRPGGPVGRPQRRPPAAPT